MMSSSPGLEQLLAETLPTPPSTLENARFLFDKPTKTSRSSLAMTSAALPLSTMDDSPNSEHVVPDILTPTALPTTVMPPIPDIAQLAAPPTRRQLRKRRQPAQFHGLDTSDDELNGSDPDFKRAKADSDYEEEEDSEPERQPSVSRSTRRPSGPARAAASVRPSAGSMLTIQPEPTLHHHHDSDDEFGHEHLMSPEEEADLRRLLEIRQGELDECGRHMKGMTPAQKKRLRNKHASCVSRLKKKLYICNLVRELDRARDTAASATAKLEEAQATIAQLRQANGRLLASGSASTQVTNPLASILAPSPKVSAATSPSMALSAAPTSVTSSPSKLATTTPSKTVGTAPANNRAAPQGDGESYCVCFAPASNKMLTCDRCHKWFHLECMGLTAKEAQEAGEWFCFDCNAY
eukprot:m.88014 g.88014  ORF g.88014 m.88014 type:complete len:408 (+) comp14802_c0_seq1:421-1644(+)